MGVDRFCDPRRFLLAIGLPKDRHPQEQALLEGLRASGAKNHLAIVDVATKDDLGALFRRVVAEKFSVVTLLGHNDRGAIELQSENVLFVDVAALVPAAYDGYLELLVCHSSDLAEQLRWSHPHCKLFASQGEIPLKICLHLYFMALKLVVDTKSNYMDAVVEARTRFMRRTL